MSAPFVIVGARLLQFASILVLFGSSLFYFYGFGAASTAAPNRWLWPRRILLIAASVGIASALLWLMGQTASLMDDSGAAIDPAALWLVLSDTQTGRFCLLRLSLLALSFGTLFVIRDRPRLLWRVQACLGALLVMSFAWSGHGARDQGWSGNVHLVADVVHLLAAGVWIGALVPLAILIVWSHRAQSRTEALAVHLGLTSFSGIGLSVVTILVLTGLVNSWFLIGPSHWCDLFSTAYGLSLTFKLGLFGLMLLLAAAHRFWLTPRLHLVLLENGSLAATLRTLRATILTETALALLLLAAVAFLGTQPPPITGGLICKAKGYGIQS